MQPKTLIFGGLACVSMMFVESKSLASIVLPLVGKFFLTGGYGGIYVYTAEIFPTVLRNYGVGICSSVARIGGKVENYFFKEFWIFDKNSAYHNEISKFWTKKF